MPDKDNKIRADHFEHLIQKGHDVPEAKLPELHLYLHHVFDWWTQMNAERPSNGMSVMVLSSKFMYDYLSVYDVKPMSIELEILKTIEREYLKANND